MSNENMRIYVGHGLKKMIPRVLVVAGLVLLCFVTCKNPAGTEAPATGRTVSDWAGLAEALEDPAVREIDIAEGAGHISADRAVTTAGAKTINLPANTAVTLQGLVLADDFTAAYNERFYSSPAYVTLRGKVSVPAEKRLLIGENIVCNINSASITVQGLLAFENENSLPGNTYALIGGSGGVCFSFSEDAYQDIVVIPALGLLLERPPGETLVTSLPERGISLSQESLVIMDFLAEGYEPSGFRTVRIANEGNVETGALEASADDPCLEFDGGVSTLAIDSIPAGGSAQFGFRIKAGLAAGLYQATVTVSGISLQEKSFPVVFEVGAPGGLNSIQAIENYLASETGSLAQPLGITTSLNLMEWPRLLELLDAAGDYVSLDLSDCPISALTESTAFDPDPSISAGKDRIVSLILPEAVNSIVAGTAGNPAFGGFASLERLGARNVTGAGAYCFTDLAALKTLDLPALASIGSYAFSGCAVLNTLDLPTLASVGDYAFSGCVALESVNLPALASIGNGAFSGCESLETVELPALVNMTGALVKANNNRITYLPLEPPFLNCVGLRSVSLPALRLVYSEAFTGCASLESISLGSEPPSLWNLEVIDGSLGIRQRKWLSGCATAPRTITVYVPAAALGAYLSAWDGAISTSGMLNSVTAIQTWNYVWDNDLATRENLTVQLAEIKGGTNE